ncbi:rCG51409 [Rattus norvegicus]|uniref:RCG51409 n=1 Tax=Rattus norvegicus TaxID=10116 RepID=A6IZC0_RAT|nr:rCG51409 [Rattus norvegicus]
MELWVELLSHFLCSFTSERLLVFLQFKYKLLPMN